MPRYYFHTANGSRDRDIDGTELADENVARREAIRLAGIVLNDEPDVLWDGHDFRVEVTDQSDLLLFTVITLAINAPASGQS